MLTQKPPTTEPSTDPHTTRKGARPQDDTVCWFEGQWTPLADAKVSIMTHSFLYGTAVFEGIRAYWNADDEQLYLLKAREHFERIVDSSKILMMDPGYSVDEMVALTIELLRRNGYREDCYVRATIYKSRRGHRRQAARPAVAPQPHLHPLRRLHRHGPAHRLRHRLLAAHGRPLHPVAGQGRGLLREPGLLQDGGRAQRLRGGHRADPRGQGLRGQRGEPLHGPQAGAS